MYQNIFFYLTNKSIDIYLKYLIFNDLEFDSGHTFSINFSENENVEQIEFAAEKKCLIINLKHSVTIETEMQ